MQFSENERLAIDEIAALDQNDLLDQIKEISTAAWDREVESISVRSWLNNFSGDALENEAAERNLALWILNNFVLYTDRDVRALSTNLWWQYIHFQLDQFASSGFMESCPLQEKRAYIVEKTVIQPLGNCSGSGTNVAYFFRQSNRLKKERFKIPESGDFEYLVLVDDATLSGEQAEENFSTYDYIHDKKKIILTFISTDEAKSYLSGKTTVLSAIDLDEKSKCFSEQSYVFKAHCNWIPVAKRMCNHYGRKLDPRNPLGYRKGQYTFGYYYNIPNNSLPIFWGTIGGWVPLFTRYFCDERDMEELVDEKFY